MTKLFRDGGAEFAMFVLCLIWHATLLRCVVVTEEWIEFTDWYFNLSVPVPLIICTVVAALRAASQRKWTIWMSLLVSSAGCLSLAHWVLLRAAVSSV